MSNTTSINIEKILENKADETFDFYVGTETLKVRKNVPFGERAALQATLREMIAQTSHGMSISEFATVYPIYEKAYIARAYIQGMEWDDALNIDVQDALFTNNDLKLCVSQHNLNTYLEDTYFLRCIKQEHETIYEQTLAMVAASEQKTNALAAELLNVLSNVNKNVELFNSSPDLSSLIGLLGGGENTYDILGAAQENVMNFPSIEKRSVTKKQKEDK